jgi:Beta-galactosidase jelly roll domain
VSFEFGGGGAGLLQAWLDGVYLGQYVLPTNLASPPTRGTATFTVPDPLQRVELRPAGSPKSTPCCAAPLGDGDLGDGDLGDGDLGDGDHVLSVMVRDDSHNEDGGVNDAQKEGRGLIGVSDLGSPATWKIQGGAATADPVRGPLNNGGLYGERTGWSLPGFPDRTWATRPVPDTDAPAGTSWYRTTFDLRVPAGEDASVGLTIGDLSVLRSGGHYRVLIFLNGWNMGQYIADVGPQHTFVLPTGILDPHGNNTLALAVTSDGGPTNALETVRLTNLGTARGGVPVAVVRSPGRRS